MAYIPEVAEGLRSDIRPERPRAVGRTAERADMSVLLKLTSRELADIDRVRGSEPRTKFIKRYMAAVVRRLDEVGGEPDGA